MPVDDVALACRLADLSLLELWIKYMGLGGHASVTELCARVVLGTSWPPLEDLVLVTAAEEALVAAGLPPLT
jgi:hypothetical protein